MPPVAEKLNFHAWQRPRIFQHVSEGARLSGDLDLQMTDTTTGQSAPGTIAFELLSASDITSLDPRAIRHLAPAPMVTDAETTKFVHVDFWERDLPWRYTPKQNDPARLRPWMVLLVGTPGEITIANGQAALQNSLLADYDLSRSHLWAHTQFDGGSHLSRIVSTRTLLSQQEYVAVLVPAFNRSGTENWTVAGNVATPAFDDGAPPPALFSWRFWTTESGDFESLATALHIPEAGAAGTSDLYYSRVDTTLQIRGAITSLQPSPPQAGEIALVRDDLDDLNEELGEDIISLPHYGRPWVADPDEAPAGWATELNDDPRFRGIAGLGVEMGVQGQESLIDAAITQAGALREAGKIINHLATGLEAAGRLWARRLDAGPQGHLRVLAPMLDRIVTEDRRHALTAITSGTSPLEPAFFSGAAQRILRDRAAHSRHLTGKQGGIDTSAAFDAANTAELQPDRTNDGLPHVDGIFAALGLPPLQDHFGFDDDARRWVEEIIADLRSIIEGIPFPDDLAVEIPTYLHALLEEAGLRCGEDGQDSCQTVESMQQAAVGDERDFVAFCRLMIGSALVREGFLERLASELRYCIIRSHCLENVGFFEEIAPADICRGFGGGFAPEPPPIHVPIDPGGVAGAIDDLIDPRRPEAPARLRVCARLEGVDCTRLTPPEFAIGLDYPTWDLLRAHEREWLLPGAQSLAKDSITALRTNPEFIDAYMVGINSEFLSEMRWRDLAVDRSCTPLRMFWGQVDYARHTRSADIEPLAEWAKDLNDPIGSLDHQTIKPADPANADGSRLVIAFRSDLFRRYPSTLVYLVKPASTAELDPLLQQTPVLDRPDSAADIEAWRQNRKYFGPIFTGSITPEITFFIFDVIPSTLDQYWLVLDEPPAELRLRHKPDASTGDAAQFAATSLDQPTRVAISGKALEDLAMQP